MIAISAAAGLLIFTDFYKGQGIFVNFFTAGFFATPPQKTNLGPTPMRFAIPATLLAIDL